MPFKTDILLSSFPSFFPNNRLVAVAWWDSGWFDVFAMYIVNGSAGVCSRALLSKEEAI